MNDKKFLLFTFSFFFLFLSDFAQNNPVHFVFSTNRKNDSLVNLIVNAKLDKGFFLFSIKPKNSDDAFISQLNLDSTLSRYLVDTNIIQSSNITSIKDNKTNSLFNGFYDSVTFIYPLKIKNSDSIIIKGSFAWLGKMNDAISKW